MTRYLIRWGRPMSSQSAGARVRRSMREDEDRVQPSALRAAREQSPACAHRSTGRPFLLIFLDRRALPRSPDALPPIAT